MGEKVYKPIKKEGDHLLRSKNNLSRVRGLTRDENNQNQDIIEWEEYDLEDLLNDNYDSYEEQCTQLTPEQEQFANILGVAIATGSILLFQEIISPWWKNTVWPWVKEKSYRIKNVVSNKKKQKITITEKVTKNMQTNLEKEIDKTFESFYFEMDEDEAKNHIMILVYHMLGVINQIRRISNARIVEKSETEELCIEKQKQVEKFLVEKVATELNQLLSNENLQLDLDTSRELFSLTGGGIYHNGEYVPVQTIKIAEALKKITIPEF